MYYEVTLERRAGRRLRRLPLDVQRRVEAALEALQQEPRPRGAEKLKGALEGSYRIRVGIHYRVVYEVDDDLHRVHVVNVGSRESIY